MSTFIQDFLIAEPFGMAAIKDTYKRSFRDWKHDYKMLTDLVIAVNYLCWHYYEIGNADLSELYSELYYKCRDYALDHLKGEEFQYFWKMTD